MYHVLAHHVGGAFLKGMASGDDPADYQEKDTNI
jgi:hypothetical protein